MPIPKNAFYYDIFSKEQKFALTEDETQIISRFRRSVARSIGIPFYQIPKKMDHDDIISLFLQHRYHEYFGYWYKPGMVDIYRYSEQLAGMSYRWFEYWWDPNQFDFENCSGTLIYNMRSYFSHFWNPVDMPIPKTINSLISCSCPNFEMWWDARYVTYNIYHLTSWYSKYFHIWWDADKFWEHAGLYSRSYVPLLARNCIEHFDTWWNPDIYDFGFMHSDTYNILKWHILKWWDSNKMPDLFFERHSIDLCKDFPKFFDLWWDKKRFNYGKNAARKRYGKPVIHLFGREYLMTHCSDHIETWYDKRKIRPTKANLKLLRKHCSAGHAYWGPDYITMTLGEEGE